MCSDISKLAWASPVVLLDRNNRQRGMLAGGGDGEVTHIFILDCPLVAVAAVPGMKNAVRPTATYKPFPSLPGWPIRPHSLQ